MSYYESAFFYRKNLIICKYESFCQEVILESLLLKWPLLSFYSVHDLTHSLSWPDIYDANLLYDISLEIICSILDDLITQWTWKINNETTHAIFVLYIILNISNVYDNGISK